LIFIAAVIPLIVVASGVRCSPDRDQRLEHMLAAVVEPEAPAGVIA